MRKKSTHKQSVPEVVIYTKKREEKTNTNKRNGMFLVFLITIPFKKGASYPSPILHRMGKKLSATPTLLMVIVRMMMITIAMMTMAMIMTMVTMMMTV